MKGRSIRGEIVRYGRKLLLSGLVKGTWGNISVLVKDVIFITPSGADYDKLRPRDIAAVDAVTLERISGAPPSSELPMHAAIYLKGRTNALIHTHSEYLTACSVTASAVPPLTEDQVMIIGGGIPVADYHLCGTAGLADSAAEYFSDINGVILANHGYVGGGRNLREAFVNCLIAEKSAAVYLHALASGREISAISPGNCESLRKKYISYAKGGL